MSIILEIRALLIKFYQKFQVVLKPAFKFVFAYMTLFAINSQIGYDERLTSKSILLVLSLLCAFTPQVILVFIALILSVLHVYSVAPLLAAVVLLVYIILYALIVRFATNYSYAVVAIPILFHFNLQYAVPLYLGMIANPLMMLPTTAGVVVYYIFELIKERADNTNIESMNDILPIFQSLVDSVLAQKQIVGISLVFAFVIIAVYTVRRIKMSYSYEIAIIAGAVVNIFGFLVMELKLVQSADLGKMMLGTAFSVIICFILLFFKRILDYSGVENVQFEDDDYYYYVKAVPKMKIAPREKKVKHINQKSTKDSDDEEEEEAEAKEVEEVREKLQSRKVVSVYGKKEEDADELNE